MKDSPHYSGPTGTGPAAICACVLALLLVSGPRVHADLTAPEARPQAKPLVIRALRGVPTAIQLSVSTNSPKPVEFIIRTQPEHGKLGAVVTDGKVNYQGTVEYTAPLDPDVKTDVFRYAAKVPELTVSDSVPVKIIIVEALPLIVAPRALNLGRIMLGKESVVPMELKNSGEGTFDATISLPEPFHLPEEAQRLVVKAGEAVLLPVIFRPTKTGTASHRFVLQPESRKGIVELFGEAYAPFSVSPTRLVLKWDAEKGRRVGTLSVTNAMPEEQILTLASDQRLWLQASLKLPAESTVNVDAFLPANDALEYGGEVAVASSAHTARIGVTAPRLPAVVDLVDPEPGVLELAGHLGGEKPKGKLVLRNSGGERAFVYCEVTPPFQVVEGTGSVALEPGTEVAFHVTLDTDRLGSVEQKLSIIGGPKRIEVSLKGVVARKGEDLREVYAHSPGSKARKMSGQGTLLKPVPVDWVERDYFKNLGYDSAERVYTSDVPTVEEVYLKESTQERVDLWWDRPDDGKDYRYIVETKWARRGDDGMPVRYWVPLSGVEFGRDGGKVTAVLDGLEPNASYVFRIVATDGKEAFGHPSEEFKVATLPDESGSGIVWILLVLVAVGGGAYFYWRRSYQWAEA